MTEKKDIYMTDNKKQAFYFAQFTDLHVGSDKAQPEPERDFFKQEAAEQNLLDALEEVKRLAQTPDFILVTGDIVTGGTRKELEKYIELIRGNQMPLHHLPARHDLWGEVDISSWQQLFGKTHYHFDHAGVRFFIKGSEEGMPGKKWAKWSDAERRQYLTWLKTELDAWHPKPAVLATHSPLNDDEMVDLLSNYNILAVVTGHLHVNNEWTESGNGGNKIRNINSGALMGYYWTGNAPHYLMPVRPGYRLFYFDGKKLDSFWRELRVNTQATITWVGNVHTMGPRPLVQIPIVSDKFTFSAQGFAFNEKVEKIQWGLLTSNQVAADQSHWVIPLANDMEKTFDGLWSNWQGEFEPDKIKLGKYILVIRAVAVSGQEAYEGVPVVINEAGIASASQSVESGALELFELFNLLPGAEFNGSYV